MVPTEKILDLKEVMERHKVANEQMPLDKDHRWMIVRRSLNDIPLLLDELRQCRAHLNTLTLKKR